MKFLLVLFFIGASFAGQLSAEELSVDRLEMESISIVGSRETQKLRYIVPWKSIEDKASNSFIDGLLMPVERSAFQRHLKYFSKG